MWVCHVTGMNHHAQQHITIGVGARRRRGGCLPKTWRIFQREMGWNNLADMAAVSDSGQSSLKMHCCSPIKAIFELLCASVFKQVLVKTFHRQRSLICMKMNLETWKLVSRRHFHDSIWHRGKPQLEKEGMVNDDDTDLPVRSFDIHGIPRPDESRHFDGRPRAVWLFDCISLLLQEFPPVKYSKAYYNHSTDPNKNVSRPQVL